MIVWLTVKKFCKKAWAWVKKYWQLFLGMAVPLVIWLLTRNSDRLDEVLEKTHEAHRKEVEAIDRAHSEEIQKREEALEKHKIAMAEVEKKYQDANRELSLKKRREVERVIKKHADDPDEITRRLSAITGFDLHEE
jgi:hypothetical protein